MIIPDINILIYAYDQTSPYHKESRLWWEETVNSGVSIGLPAIVILGFLRITTHPKVWATPLPIKTALETVGSWLEQPTITIVDPTSQHWRLLSEFLLRIQLGGKLVSDAHLAAIAREHRATLVTNDRDFERFAGVSLLNPLSP